MIAPTLPLEKSPVSAALAQVQADLLAERNAHGYWEGRLCSSPLSTATAISALAIAEQHSMSLQESSDESMLSFESAYQSDLSELIVNSLNWLARQQNDDGGWGDTDRSASNIAATMLVHSAFRLTGVPAKFPHLETKAEAYLKRQGGIAGLKRRYGADKTFAAPILTNLALAGVIRWSQVPTLPFEMAAAPPSWFRLMRLPVVSYAIPALVAIGLCKFHHRKPKNPLSKWLRGMAANRCVSLVQTMQPDSGGFLEAIPLTSFVVMGLASTGRSKHPIVRKGIEFLLASARPDGSWPIDENLATWNTTLAVNALGGSPQSRSDEFQEQESERGESFSEVPKPLRESTGTPRFGFRQTETANAFGSDTLSWLLSCQHTETHPFTGAAPGGWAWTNLSGGVPDADDTPGALLALYRFWQSANPTQQAAIANSVQQGLRWLLDMQNRDGGWPTFCRGWGLLPFDRSATDLTAHALRALSTWANTPAWRELIGEPDARVTDSAIDSALLRGGRYLAQSQADDGSWNPLWFGNERRKDDANPVYGTSKVVLALTELAAAKRADPTSPLHGIISQPLEKGTEWLLKQQHASGGWGTDPLAILRKRKRESDLSANDEVRPADKLPGSEPHCTVEETAVATEALANLYSRLKDDQIELNSWAPNRTIGLRAAVQTGAGWLTSRVENGEHREASPIGLYFAKLWYYEKLYPLSFTAAALRSAEQADCLAAD